MTGRNWTEILGLALVLTLAMIAVLVIGLLDKPTPAAAPEKPPAPAVRWYYGQHTVAKTAQKGVVVDCVERTNSVKFGNREYAKPGDVYQFTCRARRAS
jgi:hypothetical protein